MKESVTNAELVAYCGLYCGACRSYLKGKCPTCHRNEKAGWCKIRLCCIENGYLSCADCTRFDDPADCSKFSNLMARVIGFLLRSDRPACIRQIKELGIQGHADMLAGQGRMSVRR
jgi:hypothetical protein